MPAIWQSSSSLRSEDAQLSALEMTISRFTAFAGLRRKEFDGSWRTISVQQTIPCLSHGDVEARSCVGQITSSMEILIATEAGRR